MDISVTVSNLTKSYANLLFSKVYINQEGPARIALIGANGSGKSTFLKILAGMDTPDSGKVLWGKDVRMGYLEQEIVNDLKEASGGEKKIIKITELFNSGYNVLLLDEPDNHLDLDHKEWFLDLVLNFKGLLIVISHDRTFLRNGVNKIWLLEELEMKSYPFDFDKFEEIYDETMDARKHLWKVQEKERIRLSELVKKFRFSASASTYHNMEKRYARFCELMVKRPEEVKNINLTANTSKQHERKTAIHLKNLNKSFGKIHVLRDLCLHVFCGEKIAINAPNGSGKSTLLKILSGQLAADLGEIYFGPNLKVGNYTQEHIESLDENLTLIQELQKTLHLDHYNSIAYLKRFAFLEDQITQKVKRLSGGQKSRLQLAKFLATNPDILILDEPTNHLDLKTVIALENFLLTFKGTLVLVSHDLELVGRVADKAYQMKDGKIIEN